MAGTYGRCTFNFFWNNRNISHIGSAVLYSHQQRECFSSSYLWQHSICVWSVILMLAILLDVQCFLVCMSLMANNGEHVFMWLFSRWMSSLVKHLFRYFAYYLIELFIFLLLSFESSLYNLVLSSLSDICFQMFSPDL